MSLKVINIDENCNEIDEINKKIAVQIHIFIQNYYLKCMNK